MASSVTPKQIYSALTSAGASTVQAIGIMANMLAESGLNPEAVGDQGTSFGLVQQHGGQYASLVTGNPARDMTNQIKVVAQNGGFAAANGSTAAAAAGNFSANYERCTTCQAGQSSYNERVANASTVAGWVSSGKWPTSAGTATAAAAGGGTASNSKDPTCAWGFSGSIIVKSVNVCVVKKATLRHIVGGGLLIFGGSVVLVGAVILAASAFQRTGGLNKAADAAAAVPGGGAVAAGLSRAHSRTTRTGSQVASQRATARRQQQAAAQRTARQQQAAAKKAAQTPRGRHAKTGPNAPATGKRNKPGP